MLENINKSDDQALRSEMDDGGRCLLDVINDPQLLQSFLGNSGTPTAVTKNDETAPISTVNTINAESTLPVKKEVKAKKSPVVATKSSPTACILANEVNNGKQATLFASNTLSRGLITMDANKQSFSIVPNSVGVMSMTNTLSASAQSVTIQQPLASLNSSTLSSLQNSSAIRASTSTVFPQTQFQIGPRQMTVLPQQLIMPGMQMGQQGISQILLTSRPPNPTSSMQTGHVLQIIQTSQGPQIVPTNPATSIQSIASTTTTSTSKASRSNKQILPKPLSSLASASSTSTKSNTTPQASSGIKLIQQQTAPFNTQSINATSGLNGGHQFVINSGQQQTGQIITGPQGTFLLNNVLPNMGSQPFIFQGNGLQNSVQLAIRPQTPYYMNSSLAGDPSNLSIALSNNAQVSTSKPSGSAGQQHQTFVFSNNHAPPASNSSNILMGPSFRPNTPNLFIRPQFIGAQQPSPSQPQILQIQTPNGPILVAVNSTPQVAPQALLPPPQAPSNQPQTIQIGNTVYSLAANPTLNLPPGAHPLQTILTQTPDNSSITNANIGQASIATPIRTSVSPSTLLSKPPSIVNSSNLAGLGSQSPKTSSPKGTVLADILKETGIFPELSPPTSPKNPHVNTDLILQPTPTHVSNEPLQQLGNSTPQPTVLMVPSGINASPNVLVNAHPQVASQLRLSVAPDGTLHLVSSIGNAVQPAAQMVSLGGKGANNSLNDSSGMGSSQPSPDSTTPSIDTNTNSPSNSLPQSTSSLVSLPSCSIDSRQGQTFSKSFDSSSKDCFKFIPDKPIPSSVNIESLNHLAVKSAELSSNLTSSSLSVFANRSTHFCDTTRSTTPNSDTIHLATLHSSSTSQKAKVALESVGLASGSTAVPVVSTLAPPSIITLADVNGSPILQVNSNSKDFLKRLEVQLQAFLAIKNPAQPQRELIQELTNIQQRILQPMQNLGLSVQLNLSNQAQQLLQLSKSIGNIILSTGASAANNHFQILLNQNQNGLQLVSSNGSLVLPQSIVSDSVSGNSLALKPTNKFLPANVQQGQNVKPTSVSLLPSIKTEPELKPRPNVLKAIHQQCNADQNNALRPDCKTPFRSRDDACKRLLRYHVFDSHTPTEEDLAKFDEKYEQVAQIYMYKMSQLRNKFRYLLLQQGMKEERSWEQVMIGRTFVQEETDSLKADRELVAAGKVLDLPPLPDSWLRVQGEKEVQSLKRKLPTDEFEGDTEQRENDEIANICDMLNDDRSSLDNDLNDSKNRPFYDLFPQESRMDGNRNQDIDSVDELIDQLNSQDDATSGHLLTSDHQSFLDSLDDVPLSHANFIGGNSNTMNMVTDDLEALYSEIHEHGPLSDTASTLPWASDLGCPSNSNSIPSRLLGNQNGAVHSRVPWGAHGFGAQAEAAVAVQSIINSTEESANCEDMCSIQDLESDMSNGNFDSNVVVGAADRNGGEGDRGESIFLDSDSLSQQQGFDVQMHCAIKSIMMPSDMAEQLGPQQYIDASLSNSTNYCNLPYQMMPSNMRGNNMMPYQSSVVNDSMLDEAVKSILS